ncbi:ABC-2 type transport system ATP-binding protein [Tistlia consotensis]|uniref:ABC-2 type transport system ATP-binding protein n=1 Tax=Tistlia consotensis USBA 355 TaxID=560819 RepID=A0A1Y6B8M4_9PROT|nr:ATP-binding cassette domain-containing protein [Tistlia consotensis]SME96770.1 ABC-2 type transport system ATP-binding protein [Tistlia consotensis USBA 355]SNR56126.1 ABC-2 type transport system ATP-binding protein [Tistlia consotensis]
MTGRPEAAALEAPAAAAPVVALRDVHKRFAAGSRTVEALDGLSAEIGAARITGLVGPDGAGKTTLMRLVTGLLAPDSGSIRVLGLDAAAETRAVQASVGYMPQRFGLYEDLSVAENLELYADLQGLAGAERRERFERLMAFTGLGPFRTRLAGRLSGGMKQKLGLACTLVRPPRLLLLDEPSVGVDPVSRRELWEIVRRLVGEGISVLWATAYLDEAERCHEVLLLNEGRLLAAGPPSRFSARLEGRTFAVRGEEAERRTLLDEVRALPQVVDAVVKGRDLRVLLSKQAEPGYLESHCRTLQAGRARVTGVDPLFEDAFVALMKEQPATSAGRPARGGPSSRGAAPARTKTAAGRPEAVIRVEGLIRRFGSFTAVDGIDFQVARGEIFGLLGPNGAGKSTTFKMLCGLLPPSDGRALVLGIDLRRAAAVARGHIGYMAQKFSLYGNMSVLQNLRFFASAYGLTGKARQERIEAALEEFGLFAYRDAVSETLPLGFKQRLALACAIMHDPGVLFLDEPTSGVDPLVRREFWTRIDAMAEAGVSVLVTTHFMEEAEYCDRIGIIYRGKLVAAGTPEELKAAHATPQLPEPTLEDAFVDLIGRYDSEHPR